MRHADRTLALVVIDGALRRMFTAEQVEPMFAPLREAGYKDVLGGMIDSMPGPHLESSDRAAIKAMALSQPQHAVLGGVDAALDPHAFSEATIACPVLLLMARQPTWTDEYEAYVRELAPGCDYRVLDDIGHWVQFEQPELLRSALAEFIETNRLLTDG